MANYQRPGQSSRAWNAGSTGNHTAGRMRSSEKTSAADSMPNAFDEESASHHQPMNNYWKNSSVQDKRNPKWMDNTRVEHSGSGSTKWVKKDTRSVPKEVVRSRAHSGEKDNADDEGNSYSVAYDSASTVHESAPNSGDSDQKVIESDQESSQVIRIDDRVNVQSQDSAFRYDICPPINKKHVQLNASLLQRNREIRKENSRIADGHCIQVLRPGMLILKNCISLNDQVRVIRKCRELGLGPGGFYQPGYQDGAKLKLRMMCLGKNWDPETSEYDNIRPCDGSKPPPVPEEFHDLVRSAIKDSHSHLMKCCKKGSVENKLPSMTPDICIVNFYTQTGRLGLHQDKDESQESLLRGLPVVSFSIGDSAEFLYGDQRNVDTQEKINLESGDVLIFGGRARHIYHGVSTIFPDSAPKCLLEETNMRPGRLNLTFREY